MEKPSRNRPFRPDDLEAFLDLPADYFQFFRARKPWTAQSTIAGGHVA
jgi:hypothetical protein